MKNVKLFNVSIKHCFIVAVEEGDNPSMREQAAKVANSLRSDRAFTEECMTKGAVSVAPFALTSVKHIENTEYTDVMPWGVEPIEGLDLSSRAIFELTEHITNIKRAEAELKKAKEVFFNNLALDYDALMSATPTKSE